MENIPQIVPQEGKPGITVGDLIFHKHQMAFGADILEGGLSDLPSDAQKSMAPWIETLKSAKHAVVEFPNGVTMSIITGTPATNGDRLDSGFGTAVFAKGDERVPTYEVSISVPGRESDIRCYQSLEEVNAIFRELTANE
ncbi:hypothetical protein L3V16_21090 [Brucella ciceri]|uniref:hypothetical protein n=1 Tax=Brucella ciceri TaxID=391287 RepID=UPI000DE42956|nr:MULTISPECIES: hypothetical protein [Brucella]MCH6206323.1 hypothetical protein [Brucella ciceri]